MQSGPMHEFHWRDTEGKDVGPKTVTVGGIHLLNITLKWVALHLHEDTDFEDGSAVERKPLLAKDSHCDRHKHSHSPL
jgi:hypothetical protein